MNILVTITGPSGSGKSTIENMLVNMYSFRKAISYTTRPIREHEVDGVDYYFINKYQFEQMISDDKLLEFTEYDNNYYGSSIDEFKKSQVVVLEPNGLVAVKKILKDSNIDIVSVYAYEDPDTRIKRMKYRGDAEEQIYNRIENDKKLFELYDETNQKLYDMIIKSNNITGLFDLIDSKLNG